MGEPSDDLVIAEQLAIRVYHNGSGATVVLQEGTGGPGAEEDQVIIVQPHNLPALIRALTGHLPGDARFRRQDRDPA
jgi:hypothetical protein